MHFTGPSFLLLALATHVGVLAAPVQERSLLSLDAREAIAVPKPAFDPKADTGLLPREFLNARGNGNDNGDGSGKGGKKNNGNSIDQADIQIKIDEKKKKNREIIVVKITEIIRKNSKNDKNKDNKRKQAYRNKNKNKNTIVIVVTVIVEIRNDDRNGKNHNNNNKNSGKGSHGGNRTWYAKHTLSVDNGASEEQTVQLTDYQTTYLAQNTGTAAASDASGINGLAALQTIDPNAPFQMNNGTQLLPQGAPAPTWSVVQPDPAQATVSGA